MAILRTPSQNDLASGIAPTALHWGPPVLLLVLTNSLDGWPRTAGWTIGLTWMGALCLWNAARCRRVHCLFTGPFFLAMAAIVLLAGLGVVSLGAGGWRILTATVLVGGAVLWCVPEMILGRYWRRS
jgi:hypothetical protein